MHHIAFIKCQNHVSLFLHLCLRKAKVAQRIQYKPTRIHRTQAYIKQRMANANQENKELREGLEKLTSMIATMMAEKAQATVSEPIPTVVVSAASAGTSQPIPTVSTTAAGITQPFVTKVSSGDMTNMYNAGFRPPGPPGFSFTHQHNMPQGYPWGMPLMTNEGVLPSTLGIPFPYGHQSMSFVQLGQQFP